MRAIRNKLCLIIILLVFGSQLFGYFIFNRRNHPELKWQQIESEHIIVLYHQPLNNIAKEALKISEATYNALTKSYEIELDHKVKIFISNQDDIVNGYSAAGKYIAIYVDVNDFVNIFTGKEKWLRKVISHEMSHHFVFHSIKSWIDIFLPLSALSFPNDFNEGYAMFLSGEEWGYGRSDASLRKAVYANNLSYKYGDGFYYTTGFSMVRYLYEFYGIEKLKKLLKYRDEIGLYNFKKAFKKVYDMSLKQFKEEWRRYIYTYYYGTGYELKNLNKSETSSHQTLNSLKSITKQGWGSINSIIMNDSSVVIKGKGHGSQYYYDLVLGKYDPDTLNLDTLRIKDIKSIKRIWGAYSIDLSSNSRYITFVRYSRYKNGSLRPGVLRYDHQKDRIDKIIQGDMPQVNSRGEVFYQELRLGQNYIKKWSRDTVRTILKFTNSEIGQLLLNPAENQIALTRFDKKRRFLFEIYAVDDGQRVYSYEFERMPRDLIWTGDEELILTVPSRKDSRTKLKKFSLVEQGWSSYQSPPYNIKPIKEEKTDSTHRLLVLAELERKHRKLGKIELRKDESSQLDYYHRENYYNRWIRAQNPNEIVVADTVPAIVKHKKYRPLLDTRPWITLPIPDDEGLTLVNYWTDPLMKHVLTLGGYLPYNGENPYCLVNYTNRSFKPTINLSYSVYDWIGGIWNSKLYYQDVKNIGATISFPVNFVDSPFNHLNLGTGLNYQKVDRKGQPFKSEPIFEDGETITFEAFTRFTYNLPFRNYLYHPVRMAQMSYNFSGSNSKLGMLKNFTDHSIQLNLGFAPFYDVADTRTDVFTFINRTTLEWMNGNYLAQYRPGIDSYENLPLSGGIISGRRYIRGIEKTITARRLIISKNEFWTKLSDDFNIKFVFGIPILDLKYTGIGGWFDYGKLWSGNREPDFKTIGYEFKGVLEILGIPTVQRVGRAFNLSGNHLGYYYRVDIPFSQYLF